jgi:hypothetical protein
MVLSRTAEDWILGAQIYLLRLQQRLMLRDQQEWDRLQDAYDVLEKCLKEVGT